MTYEEWLELNDADCYQMYLKLEQKLSEAEGRTFAMENKFNKMVHELAEIEKEKNEWKLEAEKYIKAHGVEILTLNDLNQKLFEALEVINELKRICSNSMDSQHEYEAFLKQHDNKP